MATSFFVTVCAWCNRLLSGNTALEATVTTTEDFRALLPNSEYRDNVTLSHGICRECKLKVVANLLFDEKEVQ